MRFDVDEGLWYERGPWWSAAFMVVAFSDLRYYGLHAWREFGNQK